MYIKIVDWKLNYLSLYYHIQDKYGVNGISPFFHLRRCGFNFILDFVVDAMHGVFLGVVKKLVELWFKSSYSKFTFSLRNVLKEIDKAIQEISKQVPHEFTRLPRGFKNNMAHFKCT